jgi:protein gp37
MPGVQHLRATPADVPFPSVEPLLEHLGTIDLSGMSRVIIGGEDGDGARSMDLARVRSIRQRIQGTRLPFFFEQWGGVRKNRFGAKLDGGT